MKKTKLATGDIVIPPIKAMFVHWVTENPEMLNVFINSMHANYSIELEFVHGEISAENAPKQLEKNNLPRYVNEFGEFDCQISTRCIHHYFGPFELILKDMKYGGYNEARFMCAFWENALKFKGLKYETGRTFISSRLTDSYIHKAITIPGDLINY